MQAAWTRNRPITRAFRQRMHLLREGAIVDFPLSDIFDLSARGGLDVAFLSGAQIDGQGRLNLSAIGPFHKPKVRLPGEREVQPYFQQ